MLIEDFPKSATVHMRRIRGFLLASYVDLSGQASCNENVRDNLRKVVDTPNMVPLDELIHRLADNLDFHSARPKAIFPPVLCQCTLQTSPPQVVDPARAAASSMDKPGRGPEFNKRRGGAPTMGRFPKHNSPADVAAPSSRIQALA
jgi:hypothetical protein